MAPLEAAIQLARASAREYDLLYGMEHVESFAAQARRGWLAGSSPAMVI
jgi:hypothetical protein